MQLLVQGHMKAGNSHFGALTSTKRQLKNVIEKERTLTSLLSIDVFDLGNIESRGSLATKY